MSASCSAPPMSGAFAFRVRTRLQLLLQCCSTYPQVMGPAPALVAPRHTLEVLEEHRRELHLRAERIDRHGEHTIAPRPVVADVLARLRVVALGGPEARRLQILQAIHAARIVDAATEHRDQT